MSQTKENRILKHFRSLMDKEAESLDEESDISLLSSIEQRELKAASYDKVILHLAKHWKMKCKDIKLAINLAKKNPIKYDSRDPRRPYVPW